MLLQKVLDLYPLDIVPDLREASDPEDVPPMAVQRDMKLPVYFDGVTQDQARKCKQAYYACNSFIDAQIGRLLDALEENDSAEKDDARPWVFPW